MPAAVGLLVEQPRACSSAGRSSSARPAGRADQRDALLGLGRETTCSTSTTHGSPPGIAHTTSATWWNRACDRPCGDRAARQPCRPPASPARARRRASRGRTKGTRAAAARARRKPRQWNRMPRGPWGVHPAHQLVAELELVGGTHSRLPTAGRCWRAPACSVSASATLASLGLGGDAGRESAPADPCRALPPHEIRHASCRLTLGKREVLVEHARVARARVEHG